MSLDSPTQDAVRVKLRKDIRIVIVEDDKGHYLLTRHCLQQAGIDNEIVWFENGAAVLDFLQTEAAACNGRRCLMLLDIRMPGVDGLEVLEQMKRRDDLPAIPVIMLTTSEDQDVAVRCYDLGCEAHIVKPPGPTLLRAISRVAERL